MKRKTKLREVLTIPDTKAYEDTLKRFKGYYCPSKIRIKREVKTNAEGYRRKFS
jgi:hypothetical protein